MQSGDSHISVTGSRLKALQILIESRRTYLLHKTILTDSITGLPAQSAELEKAIFSLPTVSF